MRCSCILIVVQCVWNAVMTSSERLSPREDASQSSTTLSPQVLALGFANNGLSDPATVSFFSASLTSTNNFINFCTTSPDIPITNGRQIVTGSCNPTPMGLIPAADHMPSIRITQPINGQIFTEGSPIVISFKTANFKTGFIANPQSNFLAAPQQLSSDGFIMGHHHLVIEALDSFDQRSPTDPMKFVFFDEIQSDVTPIENITLSPGFYRLTVTTHAANHQPVVVPQAQHGSVNDVIFFTVTGVLTRRDGSSNYGRKLRSGSRSSYQSNLRVPRLIHGSSIRRSDPATSFTLDPSVIASGFANDGTQSANASDNGHAFTPSLTSTNNFINFCATFPTIPITNGSQISNASCNPAPIGILPSLQDMPSIRFVKPAFNDTLKENTAYDVSFNVTNLSMATLADPTTNYLAAPQQAGAVGVLSHVLFVVESVPDEGTVSSPQTYEYFSGVTTLNLVGGLFTLSVPTGLSVGSYKVSSMLLTVNLQPIVLPVSQHGAINDVVYFSVTPQGGGPPPLPTLGIVPSISPSAFKPSATTVTDENNPPPKVKHAAPAIIGAVIIVIVLLLLLAGVLAWRRRKRVEARNMKERFVIATGPTNSPALMDYNDWSEPPPMVYSSNVPLTDYKGHSSRGDHTAGHSTDYLMQFGSSSGPTAVGPSSFRENQRNRDDRGSIVSVASLAPSYHTVVPRPERL